MSDTIRDLTVDELESVGGGLKFGWGPAMTAVQGGWQTAASGSYLSNLATLLSQSFGCPAGSTCT